MVTGNDHMVLDEATRRLVAEMEPVHVYLFGSRARGNATPDSDHDFFVVVRSGEERPLMPAGRIVLCGGSVYRRTSW